MKPARRLGLAVLIAMLIHGLLGWRIVTTPPPERPAMAPKKVDKYAELKAIRENVEIPKPEPPPPPPEPPKPEPPKKEEAKPKPPPKKGKKKKRMAKAKPKDAPPPPPKPAVEPPEPKPFQLTNVNLTGGVAVQKGDSDIFGDPTVKATKKNTQPEPDDDVGTREGTDDGVGTAPARKPVRKSPKILKKAKGKYPDDAPRYGRAIHVKLSILVGVNGKASQIKVIKSAGGAFDREARAVARRLEFSPGTLDGKAKAMWVPWTVTFQPDD